MLSSGETAAGKAKSDLAKEGDSSRVSWHMCNFSSLQQVDRVAKELRDSELRIDSLVLNAGIGVNKYKLSEDGIDSHFQINVLSQLHLAFILLPTLQKTSSLTGTPSRLIMMSSEMHRFAPLSTRFESIGELNTNVGSTMLYSRSKLAQVLIVRELARRVDEGQLGFKKFDGTSKREVLINVTHPGEHTRYRFWSTKLTITGGVSTPGQGSLIPAYGWTGRLLLWLIQLFMVDAVTVGCLSGLFASTPTADLLKGNGLHGQYIVPDKKVTKPSGKARDSEMASRLWDLSVALLQQKIGPLDYDFEMVA